MMVIALWHSTGEIRQWKGNDAMLNIVLKMGDNCNRHGHYLGNISNLNY